MFLLCGILKIGLLIVVDSFKLWLVMIKGLLIWFWLNLKLGWFCVVLVEVMEFCCFYDNGFFFCIRFFRF